MLLVEHIYIRHKKVDICTDDSKQLYLHGDKSVYVCSGYHVPRRMTGNIKDYAIKFNRFRRQIFNLSNLYKNCQLRFQIMSLYGLQNLSSSSNIYFQHIIQ